MAQGRAHFGRDEAVNCFVDPGRVNPFEHGKPIVGGNEGVDGTQIAQRIANFAKMDVITLLQLRIPESHNAPLRDGLAGSAVAAILSTCIFAVIIVLIISQIFIRVAYPVEPLGFKFVSSHPPPLLPGSICDGSGKGPDLSGKLDNDQADEFQMVHWGDQGFSSPQNARCEKKAAPATISVFANPSS